MTSVPENVVPSFRAPVTLTVTLPFVPFQRDEESLPAELEIVAVVDGKRRDIDAVHVKHEFGNIDITFIDTERQIDEDVYRRPVAVIGL